MSHPVSPLSMSIPKAGNSSAAILGALETDLKHRATTHLGPLPRSPGSSLPPSAASPWLTPSELGEIQETIRGSAVPESHPVPPPAPLLPSAFSLRCWCWSSRLMLDWGPSGMSSSSPRCSLPLSRCSSSDTTFRRICSSFCSWKDADRGGVSGLTAGGPLGALPRQPRYPITICCLRCLTGT